MSNEIFNAIYSTVSKVKKVGDKYEMYAPIPDEEIDGILLVRYDFCRNSYSRSENGIYENVDSYTGKAKWTVKHNKKACSVHSLEWAVVIYNSIGTDEAKQYGF